MSIKEGVQSMVVRKISVRGQPDDYRMCFTDSGQPAVYCEAAFAESFAADMRQRNPFGVYCVIDFLVL
jgi:hypothetical protein